VRELEMKHKKEKKNSARKTESAVTIETPRGSRNKIKYEPSRRMFKLSKVMPEGMVFPYKFGFVPSTKADDGDPLDVLNPPQLRNPVSPAMRGIFVWDSESTFGETCGEMAFLEDSVASATAVAEEDVKAYVLYDLFELFPHLGSRFYRSLAVNLSRRLREQITSKQSPQRTINDP